MNMFPWKDGSDFPADFDWKHPSQQPFYTKDGEPTRDPSFMKLYHSNINHQEQLQFHKVLDHELVHHPLYRKAVVKDASNQSLRKITTIFPRIHIHIVQCYT